jgi:hypothetical protein
MTHKMVFGGSHSDYLYIYTRKSRCQKNRQKPISVASQEKKLQIATLATDSAIPEIKHVMFQANQRIIEFLF